jgi:hypothetical protein
VNLRPTLTRRQLRHANPRHKRQKRQIAEGGRVRSLMSRLRFRATRREPAGKWARRRIPWSHVTRHRGHRGSPMPPMVPMPSLRPAVHSWLAAPLVSTAPAPLAPSRFRCRSGGLPTGGLAARDALDFGGAARRGGGGPQAAARNATPEAAAHGRLRALGYGLRDRALAGGRLLVGLLRQPRRRWRS